MREGRAIAVAEASEGDATDRSRSPGQIAVRLLLGAGLAVVAVLVLLLFFAWVALRVPWEVPDRAALTGPTVVVDRDSRELVRFTSQVDRRVVDLSEVSLAARNAVLAAEDARFFEHGGVDPFSLLRAVVSNVRTGGIAQGGSTLTQQYVKNAYLSPEQTITRKVREAVISIALEKQMTKSEILESYLNEVYFGELAWGVEAAALTYFGVPAASLDAGQGATLAQLLPAPSARNPRSDPAGALQRRNRVLDDMATHGFITQAAATAEKAEPLGLAPPPSTAADLPAFSEYVRRQLIQVYGEEQVLTGAMEVAVTVDRDVQTALEAAVAEHLPPDQAGHVEAAAVAIDPATGEILGLYPGRGFGPDSAIDLATQYRAEPGSSFKPFVYLTALDQRMDPEDVYPAPSAYPLRPDNCPEAGDFQPHDVHNAGGRGFGALTLEDALANSVNTVFVQLGCDVGPAEVVETADWLGVRTPLEPVPLISIGNSPLGPTVLDMASGFATLANDGLHCPAHAILSVRDRDGREMDTPQEVVLALQSGSDEPITRRHPQERIESRPGRLSDRDRGPCYAVADADHVRTMTQTLTRVVAETTGKRADIGRAQAGKTGTTDEERIAWFAGYTPDLALVVQVSDPLRDPARVAAGEERAPMRDVAGFSAVQGGTIPALIWQAAASAILADVPPRDFLAPGELQREGRTVGPAQPKPLITVTPTPTETETPSDEPTDDPGAGDPSDDPTVAPSETDHPSDPPSEPGGDGDDCFLIFCN